MCAKEKPLNEFPRHRKSKDGRDSRCSVCNRAAVSAWQRANRDKANANWRKHVERDPEAHREKCRQRYKQNPAYLEAGRRWVAANPTKRKEIARASYNRNRDTVLLRNRERWSQYDPEQKRLWREEWRAANPGKRRADNHRRRRAAFDPEGIAYIEILLHDTCSYCNGPAGEIDHIDATGQNTADNITAACRSCNASKNNRSLLVWMAQRVPQT